MQSQQAALLFYLTDEYYSVNFIFISAFMSLAEIIANALPRYFRKARSGC